MLSRFGSTPQLSTDPAVTPDASESGGPFVVRVEQRHVRAISVEAVPTLAAARSAAAVAVHEVALGRGSTAGMRQHFDQAHALPACGLTLTLPGDVDLSVEPTTYLWLAGEAGAIYRTD